MNDLFHQMFSSMVTSQVAPRLPVKKEIKKGMNTREPKWNDERQSGLWSLGLKQAGVLLKATRAVRMKTRIISTFFDHIFIELCWYFDGIKPGNT